MSPVTLTVCTTCFPPGQPREGQPEGERLLACLQAAAFDLPVQVRGTACLSACSQGCAVAVQGPGKLSYLFGAQRASDGHAQALLVVAQQHAGSTEGLLTWDQRPALLRGHLLARLPPL